MSRYTVTVMDARGTVSTVTKAHNRLEAQGFLLGALRVIGHPRPTALEHVNQWLALAKAGIASHEVPAPDLRGSVRISITQH